MSQIGFVSCGCCGNLYKADGSEDELYEQDHPNGEPIDAEEE